MYGNGVVTGMVLIAVAHKLILSVRLPALPACCVVAVGTTMRGSAGCLIATTTIRLAATPLAVFVWYLPHSLKFEKRTK